MYNSTFKLLVYNIGSRQNKSETLYLYISSLFHKNFPRNLGTNIPHQRQNYYHPQLLYYKKVKLQITTKHH